ncbi:MAG: N-6 DNA methylase, partial [Pseudomonadota bacterium]
MLTDDDRIGQGGLVEKFQDNLRAIELLRTLDVEGRHAVGDELRQLARYVGWGGLKGVFDPDNKNWNKQYQQLRQLLSDAEWAAASRSQLDAFYTPTVITNAMYLALERVGFTHGRIIDPSVGVGNFFGTMPPEMRRQSNLHGVELDILTSQIAATLYPSAKISKATGFQSYNKPSGYFDLAIGNPPFGNQVLTDEAGSAFSGWSIHNFFFAKSIELVRPGGLMSMVVSHNFLDKLDPHVRLWISRRAELVSAVRLPDTAFKSSANTEVVTDILIFKRLDYRNILGKQEMPDWLQATDVLIEN